MRKYLQYLPLLLDLTKREFKLRYLGSVLGSYWNILNPLMMIFIYTVIFSHVMHSRLGADANKYAYTVYLCSGLFAWNFFSEIVNRGAVTLLDNAAFLKKMSLPPFVLFGAMAASAAINFGISFSIFLVVLFFIKSVSLLHLAAYLGVVLLYGLFGLGLALGLGCLNVFIRDVQQMISIVFQLWFWFTPLVYLVDALPDFARRLLRFNPSYPFINSLHQLVYFDRMPALVDLGAMAAWILASCTFGIYVYKRSISLVKDQL